MKKVLRIKRFGAISGLGIFLIISWLIISVQAFPIIGGNNQRTSYVKGSAPRTSELLYKSEYIGAGPVTVDNGRIFFSSYNYSEMWIFQINCMNESDRTMIWNKTKIWKGDWPPALLPSFTIYEDRLFFTQGGILYCLNSTSGHEIWGVPPEPVVLGRRLSDSPVVDGSKVFVTTREEEHREYLFAFDIINGETLWSNHINRSVSIPTTTDETVLVNVYDYKKHLAYTECFNKENGEQIWSHSFGEIKALINYFVSPPSLADNKVFIGFGSSVYALNQETGNLLWSYTTQGNVTTTPAIAYGKIFFASTDGHFYSLDQTTGEFLWRYPIIHRVWFPIGWIAIADHKAFVTTGNPAVLYCLNETNGELLWFEDMGHWVRGICVANGNLFASSSGHIYIFGGIQDKDLLLCILWIDNFYIPSENFKW